MAIEGPLRELGIHDVFQLLDLSRKTGRLRVTSLLRDNEGTVYFDSGQAGVSHVDGCLRDASGQPIGNLYAFDPSGQLVPQFFLTDHAGRLGD